MLLVKYLQLKSSFGWSLSNLVALLRQQLFVYRDLWTWIDDPFQPPPIPAGLPEQLVLHSPNSRKDLDSRINLTFQRQRHYDISGERT